jgi:hypothetical protein
MEMKRPSAARTVSFAVLFTSLLVAAGMLGALLAIALRQAQSADDPAVRRLLLVVAWTSLVLLALDMVLLLWGAARLLSRRYAWPQRRHPPTPHVDAWAEAGRRLQVDDQEDEEQD